MYSIFWTSSKLEISARKLIPKLLVLELLLWTELRACFLFQNNLVEMKRKTSEIWCFFRAVDDTFAVCNICKAKLSYKTITTNLSKHMNRMHPTSGLNRNSKYKFQPQTTIAIDRNKAKPRNSTQELILLEFVKKHPRLLQNPTWETRGNLESLWEELSSELNSHGPPRKDIATWRRVF